MYNHGFVFEISKELELLDNMILTSFRYAEQIALTSTGSSKADVDIIRDKMVKKP